jgi:hypothetical protein
MRRCLEQSADGNQYPVFVLEIPVFVLGMMCLCGHQPEGHSRRVGTQIRRGGGIMYRLLQQSPSLRTQVRACLAVRLDKRLRLFSSRC